MAFPDTGGLDPQVFSDVVAGAFPMPGVTQRRTIRVQMAVHGIGNVACGGASFDGVSRTAWRFDQARFADLALIAEEGFVEQDAEDRLSKVVVDDAGRCIAQVLPSHDDWVQLAAPWNDVVRAATQSDAVRATKPQVAECLSSESEVDTISLLDPADPTGSFLTTVVPRHMQGLPDSVDSEREDLRLGRVYAACTAPYFEAMEEQLRPERNRMVERNRELLERFGAELAAAGYVP